MAIGTSSGSRVNPMRPACRTERRGPAHMPSIEPEQYTSLAFGRRLREAGLVASMGSVGDRVDNAVTESFFAALECELLHRHRFRTRTEARLAVFDYLEGF